MLHSCYATDILIGLMDIKSIKWNKFSYDSYKFSLLAYQSCTVHLNWERHLGMTM